MQRDMWVGVAWAAGLVVAMVSVFFYGLISYEPEVFAVTWTANEHEETVQGDTLDEGDRAEHEFLVAGANLTSVRVIVEWDDAVGDNDAIQVHVSGPEGYDGHDRGDTGSIEVRIAAADEPTATRVEGATAEHALEQLERPDDAWAGDATFTVTVELTSAPGTPGTTAAGIGAQADGANDYFLRFVRVTTDATLGARG